MKFIPYDIIRRPVITEKTNTQKDNNGQLSFEVDRKSNRIEIAKSVEKVFGVKVLKVRTMRVRGKIKRKGRFLGRQRSWKKAIVTLLPGENINFF